MKTLVPLLLAASCLAPGLSAQTWVGGEAPEFEANHWFNKPIGTSLEDLRGRVILLEFWATT